MLTLLGDVHAQVFRDDVVDRALEFVITQRLRSLLYITQMVGLKALLRGLGLLEFLLFTADLLLLLLLTFTFGLRTGFLGLICVLGLLELLWLLLFVH